MEYDSFWKWYVEFFWMNMYVLFIIRIIVLDIGLLKNCFVMFVVWLFIIVLCDKWLNFKCKGIKLCISVVCVCWIICVICWWLLNLKRVVIRVLDNLYFILNRKMLIVFFIVFFFVLCIDVICWLRLINWFIDIFNKVL